MFSKCFHLSVIPVHFEGGVAHPHFPLHPPQLHRVNFLYTLSLALQTWMVNLVTMRTTPKQKGFIMAYVENGGNGTRAALQVYGTEDENTAAAIAYENLRKPQIQRAIGELMENMELSSQDALQTIKEALEASTDKGPNWNARLKAADMLLKVTGGYAPKEPSTEDEGVSAHNINYEDEIPF